METLLYTDQSEEILEITTIKLEEEKEFFVSPVIIIVASIVAFVSAIIILTYYFPVPTLSIVLILALVAIFTLKRKHLTFFDEQYSPDINVEEIENIHA